MQRKSAGLVIALLLASCVFPGGAAVAQPAAAEVNTAVSNRQNERLAQLLEQGADPNARSGLGYTPLMMAAADGNADAVRILLEHGADPALKSNLGTTALDKARGYPAVIRLIQAALTERGISAKAPSETLGMIKGDVGGAASEASKSPYYKTCYPIYGRDLNLCGTGATFCRTQAASHYSTCLKTGLYQ